MTGPLLRTATRADVSACCMIETAVYEGDEAATPEKVAARVAGYPQGFLVMELDGEIIGFINSGCAYQVIMSDESFKELVGHDSRAPHVVIMSVAVACEHQGRGYARQLMEAFVERMRGAGKRSIHLMCRSHHVRLYEKMGYRYVGPSTSEHGGMSWYEMIMEFPEREA